MAHLTGRCRGGPYNTKNMTHGVTPYRIAVDALDHSRGMPGQQGSTIERPVVFGNYLFTGGEWHWDESSVSADRVETRQAVHNPEPPKAT